MKFEVATLVTLAASALASPAPWCMRPAEPCWKVKRAVEALDTRAADIVEARGSDMGLIGAAAYNHLVKLAAGASSDPAAFYEKRSTPIDSRSDLENDKRWCLQPAEPCWKRSVGDELEKRWCLRPAEPCWKRTVAEQSEVAKRWCVQPGEPCWKAKRAAEAILAARDDGVAEEACADGDEHCANAKRSLDDLYKVARAIDEAF